MSKTRFRLNPWNVALFYGIIATCWILFSSAFLLHLKLSVRATSFLELAKGSLFVAVTGFSLYFLLRRMVTQIAKIQSEHEAELRESEERFSKAFRSSPEGISISTVEGGRFVETNEAFPGMLGYCRDEVLGRTCTELGIWDDPSKRNHLIELLSEGKPVQGFRTCFRSRTGDRIDVELSAECIHLQGQSCLLLICRDVSVQRRLERQFQGAQRMEALGQLAAGIAHDVKNQLMLIGGSAELLEVHNDKNARYRQQILGAVERCDSLMRQLLAYSRKQEIKPESLNLSSALAEIAKMISNVLGKHVETVTSFNSTWSIYADPGQLEQVLMNLAVNARDAMPNGGTFRIVAADVSLDCSVPKANGLILPKGEYVQLFVSDTGEGMSEKLRARIFEPFFTTKERGKGTGLGLAAVYGIIKQSRGYIFVESGLNIGTSFQILFPRHAEASEHSQQAAG